jgi:hypothetical protein
MKKQILVQIPGGLVGIGRHKATFLTNSVGS